jgi:hypothetical protein
LEFSDGLFYELAIKPRQANAILTA